MKNVTKCFAFLFSLAIVPFSFGANLTQTTLSTALTSTGMALNVASATGIVGPTNNFMQKLYIIDPGSHRGELVTVTAAPNGTLVPVARLDQFVSAHASGAIVLIAPVDPTQGGFCEQDPVGYRASTPLTLPCVNVVTGDQFILSKASVWVSGWNNPDNANIDTTANVASAAGAITPSGPFFHITGALAVTGFTIPVGFAGGCFTAITDGAMTWTAAGNIAIASAGAQVAGQSVQFCWDATAAKWYPSHQ